jgi:hypothetical protein
VSNDEAAAVREKVKKLRVTVKQETAAALHTRAAKQKAAGPARSLQDRRVSERRALRQLDNVPQCWEDVASAGRREGQDGCRRSSRVTKKVKKETTAAAASEGTARSSKRAAMKKKRRRSLSPPPATAIPGSMFPADAAVKTFFESWDWSALSDWLRSVEDEYETISNAAQAVKRSRLRQEQSSRQRLLWPADGGTTPSPVAVLSPPAAASHERDRFVHATGRPRARKRAKKEEHRAVDSEPPQLSPPPDSRACAV